MRRAIVFSVGILLLLIPSTAGAAEDESARGPASATYDLEWESVPMPDVLEPHASGAPVKVLVSAQIDADFDVVGAVWDRGQPDALWVQVRSTAGSWSEWQEVAVDDEHDRDGAPGRPGSAPIFTGDATSVRFAVAGEVTGADAMLFDTAVFLASAGTVEPRGAVSDLGHPPPPSWDGADFVRDRSQWDSAGCRRDDAEFNWSTAQAVVIHHTAGSNSYTQSQVPGIIAAICNYHVNGRGWDDIGYNFLVDRYGGVWEGRTLSKHAPVQAAHTAGFNSRTQGIGMLGTFDTSAPPAAQRSALQRMVEWLTGWHSIDPTGTVTITAGSGARGFDSGELVTVPTIIGHRDLGITACPGDAFYATLPAFRTQVDPDDFGFDPDSVRCDGRRPTRLGTPGNDLIYGTGEADVIHGLGGDDWILGVDGNDVVCGGSGNDTLIGGLDTDWISGNGGRDTCAGELLASCESAVDDEAADPALGLFRYYGVDAAGNLGSPILAGDGYTTGWSAITSIDLNGDGADEIFFYRDDGLFRYYNIGSDAEIGTPINAGDRYTTDWTAVTAVDLDGDGADEIFFYRNDGLFRYYDIGANGVIGAPLAAGKGYTRGWDAITAVDLDGDGADEMFFYRDDGLFRFYNVRSDGTLPPPMLAGEGYTKNWDAVTALDLDGDGGDEMFFYRDDGLFRYYPVTSSGVIGTPILAGDWYTNDWSIISGIDLNGDAQDEIFFYMG